MISIYRKLPGSPHHKCFREFKEDSRRHEEIHLLKLGRVSRRVTGNIGHQRFERNQYMFVEIQTLMGLQKKLKYHHIRQGLLSSTKNYPPLQQEDIHIEPIAV